MPPGGRVAEARRQQRKAEIAERGRFILGDVPAGFKGERDYEATIAKCAAAR